LLIKAKEVPARQKQAAGSYPQPIILCLGTSQHLPYATEGEGLPRPQARTTIKKIKKASFRARTQQSVIKRKKTGQRHFR